MEQNLKIDVGNVKTDIWVIPQFPMFVHLIPGGAENHLFQTQKGIRFILFYKLYKWVVNIYTWSLLLIV